MGEVGELRDAVMVVGATGDLGRSLVQEFNRRGRPTVALGRTDSMAVDLPTPDINTFVKVSDLDSGWPELATVLPYCTAIVNCAGRTTPSGVDQNPVGLLSVNLGTPRSAAARAKAGPTLCFRCRPCPLAPQIMPGADGRGGEEAATEVHRRSATNPRVDLAFCVIRNGVAGFIARPPRTRHCRIAKASVVAGWIAISAATAFHDALWPVLGTGSPTAVPAVAALMLGAGLVTSGHGNAPARALPARPLPMGQPLRSGPPPSPWPRISSHADIAAARMSSRGVPSEEHQGGDAGKGIHPFRPDGLRGGGSSAIDHQWSP
ncbi:hypothetical protein [Streptomyces guryensis]|uniref:NAD dependent epimerase/dehydratase family protein n=1 Tax=Streptomyces guryensis TaxID=2886947 RepID=A0A9Q3VV67_9ACTN|nr:hypothetical protein [Streptomyces guryensis]MCD9877971.1 hypothetical protein [Streptomyces guryensis]